MLDQSTRHQILELLREKARTVTELSSQLELTDNAVRPHLAKLETEGFVAAVGLLPSSRKPNTVFGLTAKGEALFARAATPVLSALLAVLETDISETKLVAFLEETGRRLAEPHVSELQGKSQHARIRFAAQLLNQLGGLARHEVTENGQFLQGAACPLGAAAAGHAELCHVVEALLSQLLGVPVHEECQKGSRPRCRFKLGSEGEAR